MVNIAVMHGGVKVKSFNFWWQLKWLSKIDRQLILAYTGRGGAKGGHVSP